MNAVSEGLGVEEAIPAKKPRAACDGVKEELKRCLYATDCVIKDHKTPKECLVSNHPSIPQECHSLRNLFFECKRSLLDNRTRFRGHKGY
ncbi:cytochrome c oxidase assembly factor 5-like [Ornithodoros turicata]|uniref:cytochrome c oxidase assembly factor 5-like n=1 Tax=Ornithodoros turicata TaxID=34597 RepID=UPI00313986DB